MTSLDQSDHSIRRTEAERTRPKRLTRTALAITSDYGITRHNPTNLTTVHIVTPQYYSADKPCHPRHGPNLNNHNRRCRTLCAAASWAGRGVNAPPQTPWHDAVFRAASERAKAGDHAACLRCVQPTALPTRPPNTTRTMPNDVTSHATCITHDVPTHGIPRPPTRLLRSQQHVTDDKPRHRNTMARQLTSHHAASLAETRDMPPHAKPAR